MSNREARRFSDGGGRRATARFEVAVGDRLGPYRLEEKLGRGGLGEVFRAVHEALGRTVALKILRPDVAQNKEAVTRFFAEARVVNRIHHPHIVNVRDFVCDSDGRSYFVMEYLRGCDLEHYVRQKGAVPQKTVAKIALQLASALYAVHRAGIIHRDLKPGNVFLVGAEAAQCVAETEAAKKAAKGATAGAAQKAAAGTAAGATAQAPAGADEEGVEKGDAGEAKPEATAGAKTTGEANALTAKLLDFGTAKFAADDENSDLRTETGQLLGTPAYMAPEQIRGLELDARTDIYALGVLMHEMLRGEPLFEGKLREVLARQIYEPPPPPTPATLPGPPVDKALQAIVLRCLKKDPGKRFADMREMLGALADFLGEERGVWEGMGNEVSEVSDGQTGEGVARRESVAAKAARSKRRPGSATSAEMTGEAEVGNTVSAVAEGEVGVDGAGSVVAKGEAAPARCASSNGAAQDDVLGGAQSGSRVVSVDQSTETRRRWMFVGMLLFLMLVAGLGWVIWPRFGETPRRGESEGTQTGGGETGRKRRIKLESIPARARVFRAADGRYLGRTPLVVEPLGGRREIYLLSLPGYVQKRLPIDAQTGGRLVVSLRKKQHKGSGNTAAGSASKGAENKTTGSGRLGLEGRQHGRQSGGQSNKGRPARTHAANTGISAGAGPKDGEKTDADSAVGNAARNGKAARTRARARAREWGVVDPFKRKK
jgi:serine/threonine protein kinase